MSIHMPGFQSFFKFFASFCSGQISHQQHKGKPDQLLYATLKNMKFDWDFQEGPYIFWALA